jgi:hypothetical protein
MAARTRPIWGSRMAASQPVVEAPLQLTQQRMSRAVSKSAIRDKMVALPICGCAASAVIAASKGPTIGSLPATSQPLMIGGIKVIKGLSAQAPKAMEPQKRVLVRPFLPAPLRRRCSPTWSPGNPEGVADNIRRTGQPMGDALRQQHQIAIAQLLPALRFGMDPARTLADKVKTKQLLLRKGYAPWVTELAAAIVDATQAKVLQDFA